MLKIKHQNTMSHCLFKAKDTKGVVGNTVGYSSLTLFIPEPCRVADNSEIGQGSGKKPDNDEVLQVLHHHKDQLSETG